MRRAVISEMTQRPPSKKPVTSMAAVALVACGMIHPSTHIDHVAIAMNPMMTAICDPLVLTWRTS